jgi:hypothetical protein
MRVAAAVQIVLGVQLCPFHIPGKLNVTSDEASRGLALTGPAASWQQVNVPAPLMQELSTILCAPLSRASMLATTMPRQPWAGLVDIVRRSVTLISGKFSVDATVFLVARELELDFRWTTIHATRSYRPQTNSSDQPSGASLLCTVVSVCWRG